MSGSLSGMKGTMWYVESWTLTGRTERTGLVPGSGQVPAIILSPNKTSLVDVTVHQAFSFPLQEPRGDFTQLLPYSCTIRAQLSQIVLLHTRIQIAILIEEHKRVLHFHVSFISAPFLGPVKTHHTWPCTRTESSLRFPGCER